jgi:putative oxidoreductase
MSIQKQLALPELAKMGDLALLAARVATGVFLVHGVWDNVMDPARMAEFVGFMRASGFSAPGFWGPFAIYLQLAAGLMLIAGLLTRWAGLVIVGTFVVALWVVHWEQSLREWWPALSLVLLGAVFATVDAGRWALDRLLDRSPGAKLPQHER